MAGINGFPGFITDIVRGSTRDFHIAMTKNDVPVDITGSQFYVTFREVIDPIAEPTLEILIDPPTAPLDGETVGVITDEQTYALPVCTLYYSVKFINSDGAAYVIDMGKIKVLEAISSRLGEAPIEEA